MTQIEQIQIKDLNQKIDALLDTTARIDERTKAQKECQEDQEKRIRKLENRPVKQWETIVTAVVTGLVGAVIGALFANIL